MHSHAFTRIAGRNRLHRLHPPIPPVNFVVGHRAVIQPQPHPPQPHHSPFHAKIKISVMDWHKRVWSRLYLFMFVVGSYMHMTCNSLTKTSDARTVTVFIGGLFTLRIRQLAQRLKAVSWVGKSGACFRSKPDNRHAMIERYTAVLVRAFDRDGH